ncbi:MAG: hypothetical protein H0X30_10210 [Anaerolineae bacterium]|nr:hypothetical protein [Anaerolineae bacterium]
MTTNSPATANVAAHSSSKLNVQLLMKIQGEKAKLWWNISVALQVGIIFLSAYTTLTNNFTTETALFVIPIMSICSPLMRWRADILKGAYQSLLRKFEFYDGVGWAILPREKSEWLLTLSEKQKQEVTATDRMPVHYFASNKQSSAERLLENLEESTWWSKHVAKYAAIIFGVFTVFVLFSSFAVLLLAVQGALGQTSLTSIAKVIVSVIAALFSIGFIRMTVEYALFSLTSAKFEEKSCQILDLGKPVDQEEATKLLHEYQITRSGAPMLPSWAWKMNEKRLNPIWAEQRLRS